MSQPKINEIERAYKARAQLQLDILDNIERLSHFPMTRCANHSAVNPHPSDVAAFKSLITPFQPSDYSDLLQERNVNNLCAYALCPNPRRNLGPGGSWKIMSSGQIVPRDDIEMWCSDDCARRALYIQVQLKRAPAWERATLSNLKIDLADESHGVSEADKASPIPGSLNLQDKEKAEENAAILLMERGAVQSKFKEDNCVDVNIKEKETKPPSECVFDTNPDSHLSIEGYKPRLRI
ncbi:hypothetical protein CDD81_2568 [Ophiocordyceps australis]|uniref:RNA polymerase II subunit B1 CTD phosphatase RPAP2 homolog n=1 Tax=Ophiocordyceps australis TaxID=1399860 RepID=A0A2C5XYW7_9HYPO|nr:hypothetical protein CDD81_2568 [Ophiocordyceps australis]